MSKLIKKRFKIKNMHCSSCALSIDFDLEDTLGIRSSKTSYVKSESEVEFDADLINEQRIIELIKKTGYSAEVIS